MAFVARMQSGALQMKLKPMAVMSDKRLWRSPVTAEVKQQCCNTKNRDVDQGQVVENAGIGCLCKSNSSGQGWWPKSGSQKQCKTVARVQWSLGKILEDL